MKNHFDLAISYNEQPMDVIVQCLSEGLPTIYAVWPKNESLKHSFDDTYVLFTKSLENGTKFPTVWHKVHYSKEVKSPDIVFEIAIWDKLSELECFKNS